MDFINKQKKSYIGKGKFQSKSNITDSLTNITTIAHEFGFTLERIAACYESSSVSPSLALLFMLLLSFWLHRFTTARILICGFCLSSYSWLTHFLLYRIPSNGPTVPIIIYLVRDCILLSSFGILAAALPAILESTNSSPPFWLAKITDKIQLSSIASFFLCWPTSEVMVNEEEEDNYYTYTWTPFTLLFDRFAFVLSLAVLYVLVSRFIPGVNF